MLGRHRGTVACGLAICVAVLVISGGDALAQSSLGIGTAEPTVDTGGLLSGFFGWVNAQQQSFYRALTGALAAMRENPWQLSGLIGLSFAYGVFHAAGPGHGKAVISAYMLANEVALRRGIVLSFASAILQGLVAIALVGVTYLLLRGSAISMTDATRTLEIASFALVTAFGAWLLYRKLFRMRRAPAMATASLTPVHAAAGSHHHHDHHAHGHGHHHHHGPGEACSSCGHAHMPDPALVGKERLGWRDAWSAVAAVGMRPCSGALIVLTFSLLNGLYLGGVLSVFAMSIGTAITVAILASLAVGAKDLAIRYASGENAAMRITNAIEIAGAFCVFAIGLILLTAALSA